MIACPCRDIEIGRRWRQDSSLEKWFPLTADRLRALEAEVAALREGSEPKAETRQRLGAEPAEPGRLADAPNQ